LFGFEGVHIGNVSLQTCVGNSNKIEVYELVFSRKNLCNLILMSGLLRVLEFLESPWNVILAFSRTAKSWKINAGPGKSWKSINCWMKKFDLGRIF